MRHTGHRATRAWIAIVVALTLCALGRPAERVDAQAGSQTTVGSAGGVGPAVLPVVKWSRAGTGIEAIVSVPSILSGRELPDAAFTVQAATQPVPFTVGRLGADQLDLAVVLTSDTTTLGQPAGDAIRAAAVELVAGLAPGARVAIVADDPPRLVSPLSDDRDALSRSLNTRGTTSASIDAALHVAADALVGARRPVVVMGGPGLPPAGFVPAWWPDGVALYGARAEPTQRSTGELTRNTTGGFSATRPPDAIVNALDAITTDLAGQYRITVATLASNDRDVTIRVQASGVDSQVAIVVTPTLAEPAATTVLPESPPAAATDATLATRHRAGPPWLLVCVAVFCLVVLVGVALIGRYRRRDIVVSAPNATGPPRARVTPPEVTVVLSTRDRANSDGAGSSGDGEVVWSPVDALREVIRRHATTLVIEPGTDDPWPLVHAVANHDRASGGHTRVVQVSPAGVLIDLTVAAEHDVRQ